MATLTRGDIPKHLLAGIRTEFMKGYDSYNPIYTDVTMEVKSDKAIEDYAWLGSTPKMREFLDTLVLEGRSEYAFQIRNKLYTSGLSIDVSALEDNQYSQYMMTSQMMGEEARKNYDAVLAELIEGNGLCYDGQNFFDTDHAEGDSGTQINTYNGATYALDVDAVKELLQAMMGFKDDNGRPINVMPTHIMVPTSLAFSASEIFDNKNESNLTKEEAVLKGRLKVVVNPYLTNNATAANSQYYILAAGGVKKPFVFQNRVPADVVSSETSKDYEAMMNERYIYKARARFNMGFGDWRYAIRG